MKKSFPENWYKDSFEKMNIAPPDEVWNDIADKLDHDAAVTEERKRNHTIYFFLSSVPVLVSLIVLSIVQFPSNTIFTAFFPPVIPVQDKQPVAEQKNKAAVENASAYVASPSNGNRTLATVFPAGITGITLPVAENQQVVLTENATSLNENLLAFAPLKPHDVEKLKKNKKWQPVKKIPAPVDVIPAKNKREKVFYIGLGTYENMSWLMNNQTKEGMDRYSLVANKTSFTFNPSIQIGYSPKGKNFFQAEIIPVETVVQCNNYFAGGNYISECTTIKYNRYSLQAGLLLNNKDNNIRLHFVPGIYLSRMISQDLTTDASDANLRQVNFKDIAYGAELSFQATCSLSKNLKLSAGIKASSGINNINKGNAFLSGSADPTHNFSLGAGISLKYFFK